MLRVKTFLKESTISGIGLFAAESISKGTLIWSFTPGLDFTKTEKDKSLLNEYEKHFFETYCYKSNVSGLYACPIDNARFMNHSENPNIGVRFEKVNDEDVNYALADIPFGTELVINYALFDVDFAAYQSTYSQ